MSEINPIVSLAERIPGPIRLLLSFTLVFGTCTGRNCHKIRQKNNEVQAEYKLPQKTERQWPEELRSNIEGLLMTPEEKLEAMKFVLEVYEYKNLLKQLNQSECSEIEERYKELKKLIASREKTLESLIKKGLIAENEVIMVRKSFTNDYEKGIGLILEEERIDEEIIQLSKEDKITPKEEGAWLELSLEDKRRKIKERNKTCFGQEKVPIHVRLKGGNCPNI